MTRIYSEISAFYNELFPVNPDLVHLIRRYMPIGSDVLDAGCGNGHISGALSAAGFNVTGTDLNGPMIDEARKHYPDVDFHVQNLSQLQNLNQTFDVICCLGNALSYLPNPDKLKCVQTVSDTLKPGGIWISQFVNWDAIISVKSYTFPEKKLPDRAVVFNREYHSITSGTVVFQTMLSTPDQTVKDMATLYPVTVSEYLQMNRQTGMTLEGHWKDFKGTAYEPGTMTGNVFVWKKMQ